MSATDVGWAPTGGGGVKDNKEETMRLPGRAQLRLTVEQETSAELPRDWATVG